MKASIGVTDRFAGLRRQARFAITNFGRYRIVLERSWGLHQRTVVVIGLNPSTADHLVDDATIRTLYGHCEAWDRERLVMLNLFTLVTSDPSEMKKNEQPECGGSWEPWQTLFEQPEAKLLVIAAWGSHGVHLDQDKKAMRWLEYWGIRPACLGINKNGTPLHPLYVEHGRPLKPYYGRN